MTGFDTHEPQDLGKLDPAGLYFSSGIRGKLWDGCDRQLYILSLTAAAMWVQVWFPRLYVCALAIPLWLFIRRQLRQMGKWDPIGFPIIIRALLIYTSYYSARAKYHVRKVTTRKHWLGL